MGFNKGDTYEEKIVNILKERGFTLQSFHRAGASACDPDAIFIHKGKEFKLEIKKDLSADYGQKKINWNKKDGWSWAKDDFVTRMYTNQGMIDYLNKKKLLPNRYTYDQDEITPKLRNDDQKAFEDKLPIDIDLLYEFYAEHDVYYMQVGKYGFYHLKKDIAQLGIPQFRCDMKLRFRAKVHHSEPAYKYSFFAVLKIQKRPERSPFDIEEVDGRIFPKFAFS